MVIRKRRIRVVLETNVIVASALSRNPHSPNWAVVRLWLVQRLIEIVVSPEVVSEYLEVLRRLQIADKLIVQFQERVLARKTVTWVNLGPRVVASRDSDDDVFLTTARAGRVAYLVTNDGDLLELDEAIRKRLRFQIVTPAELLEHLAEN